MSKATQNGNQPKLGCQKFQGLNYQMIGSWSHFYEIGGLTLVRCTLDGNPQHGSVKLSPGNGILLLLGTDCCVVCMLQKLKDSRLLQQYLTPKGRRGVFLQKRSKSAISSSRSSNEIFFTFLHFPLQDLALDYQENMCKKFRDIYMHGL